MDSNSMNVGSSQPIQILGGRWAVSGDPDTLFNTVLGTCVCACIYHPTAGIGGMNHFILPTGGATVSLDRQARHGDTAIPLLIEHVCRRSGAKPSDLRAKLYGGRTSGGGSEIGRQNASLARSLLAAAGTPIVKAELGGNLARWVTFHPASGRVWVKAATGSGFAREA